MEYFANENDWTQTDAERWNAFLLTETGKRLVPKLIETAPVLLDKGDVNAILIRTGEFRGFQNACQQLVALAHESKTAPPVPTEYPDLTNDAAWNDGQKIEPETQPEPKS